MKRAVEMQLGEHSFGEVAASVAELTEVVLAPLEAAVEEVQAVCGKARDVFSEIEDEVTGRQPKK